MATLQHGSRTADIEIAIKPSSGVTIVTNSAMAKVLVASNIIIFDECTMSHKRALEALSRWLKDLRNAARRFEIANFTIVSTINRCRWDPVLGSNHQFCGIMWRNFSLRQAYDHYDAQSKSTEAWSKWKTKSFKWQFPKLRSKVRKYLFREFQWLLDYWTCLLS